MQCAKDPKGIEPQPALCGSMDPGFLNTAKTMQKLLISLIHYTKKPIPDQSVVRNNSLHTYSTKTV